MLSFLLDARCDIWLNFMSKIRTYSQYGKKAANLIGKMIQLYRRTKKISAQDLADRAGISRSTLHKIENGDMKCEIGIVFEVAALVGVKLFNADSDSLDTMTSQMDDKVGLLPKMVRVPKESVDDDF